jgi:hypothetical protein
MAMCKDAMLRNCAGRNDFVWWGCKINFALAQPTPTFLLPGTTYQSPPMSASHHMAASICCEVFEEKVVADLCRPHDRPDNKLTTTERERLTNAFDLTWRFMKDLKKNNGIQMQAHLQENPAVLPPKQVFCVREMAIFTVDNIPKPQQREIAHLTGYADDGDYDEDDLRARLMKIVVACTQSLENKGVDRYSQPDKAPLGFFGMFDHWQEDYMKCFK